MAEFDMLGTSYAAQFREKSFKEIIASYHGNIPCLYVDDKVTASKPYSTINEKYVCPYCGTVYYATDGGFIPGCKNCGGTMRLEE